MSSLYNYYYMSIISYTKLKIDVERTDIEYRWPNCIFCTNSDGDLIE